MARVRGPGERTTAIGATGAGAVGAFTNMAGEPPANVANRRLLVFGVRFSAAGAASFAIRATNDTTNVVVYPGSGDLTRVGDGVRNYKDSDIEIEISPGFRLQWQKPEGVAGEAWVDAVVIDQRAGLGP